MLQSVTLIVTDLVALQGNKEIERMKALLIYTHCWWHV